MNFTEYGTAYGPVSYSPVSVPIGFTLDPVTGEGRWTPGAADVGSVPITVRATNDIGSRDITLIPTGAVWHKGVTITPLDADGRAGVSTPLIPYNGALPAGIPPASRPPIPHGSKASPWIPGALPSWKSGEWSAWWPTSK